jgi:hypothetical protein
MLTITLLDVQTEPEWACGRCRSARGTADRRPGEPSRAYFQHTRGPGAVEEILGRASGMEETKEPFGSLYHLSHGQCEPKGSSRLCKGGWRRGPPFASHRGRMPFNEKKPSGSLYHLSHGQREPDG